MDNLYDRLFYFWEIFSRKITLKKNKYLFPEIKVEVVERLRGENFVEPNFDFQARIFSELDQFVGQIDFGISPLGETTYIYDIEVREKYRRKCYALASLIWIYKKNNLPITPVHIIGSALEFWSAVRSLPSDLIIVLDELRASEMPQEKERWRHLIRERRQNR